jgi:RimJ/RimL family protein N-acetyltransferase
MEPIELATAGLLLRAWRDEDADAVLRAVQDPLIQRWTRVPVPYRPEHAVEFVTEYTRRTWAEETGAPLGIFDAQTGDLLGASGLVALDRAAGSAELGTWVAPWARGRRVAERAGRAVAHWCFEVLQLRRLLWRAEVGNHLSRLVAERIGFLFEGLTRADEVRRDGVLIDMWNGVARPGEIRDLPPAWFAPGGPGARRAAAFAAPPLRLTSDASGTGITLRHAGPHDVDDIFVTCSDLESARWTTVPVPYSRESAEQFVTGRVPAGWDRGSVATFVLAGPDDRYCGSIDLRIDPTDPGSAEIGFMIAPWARNKGYATAATQMICTWGFDALALSRIVWRAHVGNEGSRRVAEKAGFMFEGVQRAGCTQRGERHDAWVAALLAGDL